MDLQSLLEADELFGWPIEAVDKLVALKQLANTDAITLAEWRERERQVLSGLPPLPGDAKKAHDEVAHEVFVGDRYKDEAAWLLLGRLSVITQPAPDNTELHRNLADLARMLKTHSQEDRSAILKRRERLIRWLREEDDDERDPVTMLPWSFIARFRVVDEPELGPTPQTVDAARRRALEQATAEQIDDAQAMGGRGVDALAPVSTDMTLYTLTRFPKLLIEAGPGDPAAAELSQAMRDLWNNPASQRALRRQTAKGWPPEYE